MDQVSHAELQSCETSHTVPDGLARPKVIKMLYKKKSITINAGLIAMATLLSACGGGTSVSDSSGQTSQQPEASNPNTNAVDVSDASIVSEAAKVYGGTVRKSGNDFSFPETSSGNGSISMTIPAGPLPVFPARRTITDGDGAVIGFGDPVILKYDMFAWSTGELVESSSQFEEAHTVQGGVSDKFPIPEYLAKSLLGRSIGDTLQIVLPVGTEDLPAYLDPTDAYVLLVELL